MKRIAFLVAALVALASPVSAQITPAWFPSVTPPIFGGPSSGVTGSGVVTAPQILCQDGTVALPCYSFASEPTLGGYRIGSGFQGWAAGGVGILGYASNGLIQMVSTAQLAWSSGSLNAASDTILSRGAANRLDLATGDDFYIVSGGLGVGTAPTAGAGAIQANGTVTAGGGIVGVQAFRLGSGSTTFVSATAPTVTSAGTSPSVVANGTAAFRVNVGTGGTATTIVMAMPAATTGWNCAAENITAAAANRANQTVKQQSSTTTAVTVQNQTVSTGAALAFTASDIVRFLCMAY